VVCDAVFFGQVVRMVSVQHSAFIMCDGGHIKLRLLSISRLYKTQFTYN
jgi:hypothetical protein